MNSSSFTFVSIKNFIRMNIEEITAQITDMVIEYAPKFAIAIITLVVGM